MPVRSARFCLMAAPLTLCAVFWPIPPIVLAQDVGTNEGGFELAVQLPGWANPPGHAPSVNPCADNVDFPRHVSERTQLVKNDLEQVTSELPDGTILESEQTRGPGVPGSTGFWAIEDQDFEVEYVQWEIACATDDELETRDADTVRRYWVRVPTPASIVPDILRNIGGKLGAPDITYTPWDDEFGWIYVTVPTDFRVAPILEVYEELTISNVAGTATGWVRATPSRVVYQPGEPEGYPVECTYEQALLPYYPDVPGECSYTYQSSSAIAVNDVFVTRTTLYWEITSSSPLIIEDNQAWREDSVAVAEIQAVVQAD